MDSGLRGSRVRQDDTKGIRGRNKVKAETKE